MAYLFNEKKMFILLKNANLLLPIQQRFLSKKSHPKIQTDKEIPPTI